jgi:hypothetical protein
MRRGTSQAAAAKAALNASQKGLKILANSTSYGIFVEVNVEKLARSKEVTCYDYRGVGHRMTSSKIEKPGRYYHPLLGTLITGAARLMLALAERNTIDQGLDWAFCDTDSLAIANVTGLDHAEFMRRVEAVLAWFEPLNPYEVKGSILQLEKVNFPPGRHGDRTQLRPISCLAISAKRYVLFDRGGDGALVIRKATAHGLGHLMPPYQDPDKERARKRMDRIGVHLWQEDLWRAIIDAHDRGRPDQVNLDALAGLDLPAASRYAATNQTFLAWFKAYNAARPHFDFEAEDFTEYDEEGEETWTQKALETSHALVGQLVAIDRMLRSSVVQTPPPDWLKGFQRPKAVDEVEGSIAEIDARIEELGRQRENEVLRRADVLEYSHLLYESGKPLEHAIEKVLRLLGYTVETLRIGDLEIDHVIIGPSGIRMIGESEGKDTSAIDISKFRQLESNIGEDFEREGINQPAKGLLFGNGFRLSPPESRAEQFTQKSLTNARRLGSALIRTADLYAVALHLLDHPEDNAFRSACQTAIEVTAGGIVVFPDP